MLVLSRKPGQEIIIDGRIRVVIVQCDRGKCRVGVCAPPEVSVDRREVHERRAAWVGEGKGHEAVDLPGV